MIKTKMVTEQSIQKFSTQCKNIFEQIGRDVIGQKEVIEGAVIAMIAGGNVLLEGVPGVGKTRLVRTLGRVFDLPFSRIQFTPDLMPSDVTGANIVEKDENLVGNMASEGTTPRRLTDLIGSLCDLTSGSGDKGTPIIYIQGYFDNYTTD